VVPNAFDGDRRRCMQSQDSTQSICVSPRSPGVSKDRPQNFIPSHERPFERATDF
jgi:hypothetical protein